MGERKILALDLGSSLGWAFADGLSLVSGQEDLHPRRNEGPGMRLIRFRRFLDTVGPVDLVVYEEVRRHLGAQAAHVYGALEGRLQEWCEENGHIPYTGIPVGTIKKVATGKGSASKEQMVSSAQTQWPDQCVGDKEEDRADALWVLQCALDGNF